MRDLQSCQQCPRLTAYRTEQSAIYPDYHCSPVAGFGEPDARLLIVGLAPGLHGANASGRPFTGDASGDMLFAALYKYGFANNPTSHTANDSMRLNNCRITNAVKCVPPGNKPVAAEINHCNRFLREEISAMSAGGVLLALGTISHRAILKSLELRQSQYPFYHCAEYDLSSSLKLIDSLHPSRYNQNTKKITPEIFERVFDRIRLVLQ